ncbi:TonB-linked outer membrane protein, SusC/RagA family [Pedobacter westerhofensis]|uniref:TonB-linked outer membrane protein, SusC/RagA family n=1 Tax=Pedobacter westerhofensis TaxID=425512 RepID=A0A521DCI5_9SPHI|nr:TonB-dependent receptor [Pedobacter westerhofensis]SMO69308.1 TonB-linked outer membrane protein, SusC/RagA family [Pedobacter westerhofensis]
MNDRYHSIQMKCFRGSKIRRVAGLNLLLIATVLMQVQAKSRLQQMTLHEKNTSVETIFRLIEKQTSYHLLYDKLDIAKIGSVSVDINDGTVEQALDQCFKNQPLSYKIFNNTIVIRKDEAKPLKAVQQQQVKGQVNDEEGKPLPGVSIKIKNAQGGTTTDGSGKFALAVPDLNITLVFSSIGFTPQEVPLAGKSTLTIGLKSESKTLSSVVVVGYGSTRKSDLTGSVVAVKAEALAQRPATNVEQQLSGKVSGVNVSTNSGRPGGNTNIVIRGANSINSSNNPLYVVDGVVLSNGVTDVSPISYLNPNDIESMNVLKDASATAIYGARGANGVILITTKRGQSGGQINYNSYVSISTMARKLDVLNSAEFDAVEDASYRNAAKYDPVGFASGKYKDPAVTRKNLPGLYDANGKPIYDTDWQKEATQHAFSQNQNLSFTGGNTETTYGVFMNYANEEGILRQSYLKRYSGRFVFDSQIKPWMKVGGSLTFNNVEENRVDNGQGGLNVTRMLVETLPIVPLRYPDGSFGTNAAYPDMEGGENPVNLELNRQDVYKTQSTIGNVYADIKLLKDLQFKSTLGINVVDQTENFYSGRFLRQQTADVQGEADITDTRTNYWQSENYFTYNKKINDNHRLDAVVGISWQHSDRNTNKSGAQGFTDDFYQYNNLGVGAVPLAPSSGYEKYTFNSYFGRVNYTIKDRYMFTVTDRYDGSSRFGSGFKYGNFPSGAFAWRVSEEDFLKDSRVISNLKLRTSYGLTGNSEIGQYRSLSSLKNSTAIFGGTRASGVGINSLANPDLKWEKTGQFDLGFELGLFQNRISIESDVYYKKTTNMLLNAPVPTSSGYTSIYKNIGSLSNKGIEFSITSANIKTRDFNWSTTFNIAINKSNVLALGDANDDIFPDPYFLSNTNIIRVGEPVGSFYGLIREGTWGTAEAAQAATFNAKPGDIKHKDVNGDGQINDADRVVLGKGTPTGYGTFSNTFKYKNLDLTVDIQYAYGNDVLNLSRHSGEDRTGQANSYATVLNGWTPENQNTMIAENRPSLAGYTTTVDSHMVEDGSYIRGRNLLLGYNFSNAVTKKLKVNNLRLYASVQNFFLITKYTGYDPEVTTYANNFSQGITFFDYPKPRVFLLGVNVTL